MPGLESKIVRACLVSLVLVIDAYFSSSPQGSLRHHRGWWVLGKRHAFTSDSLQLSALFSNDNVHNSSVPESFTIARSTRTRNTGYMAGGSHEGANQRNVRRADVRRHGELFIKPSSRRISEISRHDTCCIYKVMPSRLPILSNI